jgi:predicted transposase/invertase (TIGR01784 family)
MMTSHSIETTSKQHATPHDAFFKAMTANKEITRDLLKAQLPGHLLEEVDLESLELTQSSFVDRALDYFHCDVVYRANIRGKEGYITFLLEHQSTPDPWMAVRLLQYQLQIGFAHIKQHTGPGPCKLPSVIPLCFYHGRQSPYPYSTKIMDCFMDPEFAQKYTFQDFWLVDLTQLTTEQMKQHGLAALLELLLQRSRHQESLFEDIQTVLEFLRKLFSELRESGDLFEVVLEYTLSMSGDPRKEDELIQRMVSELPEKKEAIMSYSKRMEEIGMQKGMQQGMQQGFQKGQFEGRFEVARALAERGFELSFISVTTGLSMDQLSQLSLKPPL